MMYEHTNKKSIKNLFNNIADSYDKLNFLMSFGMQKLIKKSAVKKVLKKVSHKPLRILDLCCGTGDIVKIFKEQCPNVEIIAVDFSQQMLDIARCRYPNIQFIQKDVLDLGEDFPFEKNSFDICFISFGLRNLPDIDLFLNYIYQYLRPSGILSILDLGKPTWYLSWYFKFHYAVIIPFMAKLCAKDFFAYKYLVNSAKRYPAQEEILKKLLSAGYIECENINYFGGIIAQQVARVANLI